MKNRFLKFMSWHENTGKVFHIIVTIIILAGLIGLVFGVTKCNQTDEIIYSNTFLNEEIMLHDNNYKVKVTNAKTIDSTTIIDRKQNKLLIEGHYIAVDLSIEQLENSTLKSHKIDKNDFKLKDHTGVHVPLNDIASLVGWDMIDYHWDQAKNGFVVSSASFDTYDAIEDYSYIKKELSPGAKYEFTILFPMLSKYNVENQIMVLEIDFFVGGYYSSKNRGEDIILLPRPQNLIN